MEDVSTTTVVEVDSLLGVIDRYNQQELLEDGSIAWYLQVFLNL
jgi:hypothetical protein